MRHSGDNGILRLIRVRLIRELRRYSVDKATRKDIGFLNGIGSSRRCSATRQDVLEPEVASDVHILPLEHFDGLFLIVDVRHSDRERHHFVEVIRLVLVRLGNDQLRIHLGTAAHDEKTHDLRDVVVARIRCFLIEHIRERVLARSHIHAARKVRVLRAFAFDEAVSAYRHIVVVQRSSVVRLAVRRARQRHLARVHRERARFIRNGILIPVNLRARRSETGTLHINMDTVRTELAFQTRAHINALGPGVSKPDHMACAEARDSDFRRASVVVARAAVAIHQRTVIRNSLVVDGNGQHLLLLILCDVSRVLGHLFSDLLIPTAEVVSGIRVHIDLRRRSRILKHLLENNVSVLKNAIFIRALQRAMIARHVGHGEVLATIVEFDLACPAIVRDILRHGDGGRISEVIEAERSVLTTRLVGFAENGVADPLDQGHLSGRIFLVNGFIVLIRSILIEEANLNGFRLVREILERDDIRRRVRAEHAALHVERRVILRAILGDRRGSKNRHTLGVSGRGRLILRPQHRVGILYDIPHRIFNLSPGRIDEGDDVLRNVEAQIDALAGLVRTFTAHRNRVLGNRLIRRERSAGDNLLTAYRRALLIDITHLIGEVVHLPLRINRYVMRQRLIEIIKRGIRSVLIPAAERITQTLVRNNLRCLFVDFIRNRRNLVIIIDHVERNRHFRQLPARIQCKAFGHLIVALIQSRQVLQRIHIVQISKLASILRAVNVHEPPEERSTFHRRRRFGQIAGEVRIKLDRIGRQLHAIISEQIQIIGLCSVIEIDYLSIACSVLIVTTAKEHFVVVLIVADIPVVSVDLIKINIIQKIIELGCNRLV